MGYYEEQEQEKIKKKKLERDILNNERNKHVIYITEQAKKIINELIISKHNKQDVILLGEIILDIGRRLD